MLAFQVFRYVGEIAKGPVFWDCCAQLGQTDISCFWEISYFVFFDFFSGDDAFSTDSRAPPFPVLLHVVGKAWLGFEIQEHAVRDVRERWFSHDLGE